MSEEREWQTAGSLIAHAYENRSRPTHAPRVHDHPTEPMPDYRAGDRLCDCFVYLDLAAAAALLKIPLLQNVFSRPRANSTRASGGLGIGAYEFAALLADLALWGLPVDPKPWVQALRPPLLTRHFLTQSELRVLWFPREQHRLKPTLAPVAWPPDVPPRFTTASGRTVERWSEGARSIPTRRPAQSKSRLSPAAVLAAP